MIPEHGLHLADGVTLRHRNEDGTTTSIAAAGGREQCTWTVSCDEAGKWYAAILFRAGADADTSMDLADVVLGPVGSEADAIRLVADQLAVYVAAATGGTPPWHEAAPDLPGSGLSKDLLGEARERSLLDRFKKAFDSQLNSNDDDDDNDNDDTEAD